MDSAADALDAGLLKYSDGAVVGTGGFVETATSGSTSGTCSRSPVPQQLRPVPVVERATARPSGSPTSATS